MKYLAIFIFLSFVGMAIFGFAGMAFDLGHGHASCIAVRANGAACPESGGIFAFSAFHLSAFKKFSTAVFVIFTILLSFLLIAALLINPVFLAPVFNIFSFVFKGVSSPGPDKLLSWLSLHEGSPYLI